MTLYGVDMHTFHSISTISSISENGKAEQFSVTLCGSNIIEATVSPGVLQASGEPFTGSCENI